MLSGLDPSGGAGIQADIQAITSIGAHPLPVLTCLTVQDTRNVYGAEAVRPELIKQQLECLSEDTPVHAIKTGALGNAEVVEVLVEFIDKLPAVPLIVDPVIKAAGGGDLADDALVAAMKEKLFGKAEIITPNGIELAQLGGSDNPSEAAHNLLQTGCESVLATGGHGTGIHIINTLYTTRRSPWSGRWSVLVAMNTTVPAAHWQQLLQPAVPWVYHRERLYHRRRITCTGHCCMH